MCRAYEDGLLQVGSSCANPPLNILRLLLDDVLCIRVTMLPHASISMHTMFASASHPRDGSIPIHTDQHSKYLQGGCACHL